MAIDGARIVRAVMQGSATRDSKGIIPIFGVYLSLNYASYYNMLCFEFERILRPKPQVQAVDLLIRAAQECSYATFHGIRTSSEWDELVRPMIETETDQIEAFAAIAVALGWGDLKIKEIVPHEKLVIQAMSGYESDGYLLNYGKADSGKCFMLCGVTAGFMDLMYGPDYPDGCFTYKAQEKHCRAQGDPCCEFVAVKRIRES
ncbi:MAG: hypothetical protein HY788_00730 [Deltaproteobacteria bacterium]|nr:hypothetical protein [Deltaproteobacteria bacterium]